MTLEAGRQPRLRGSDLVRLLISWVASALALGLTARFDSGLSATTPWAWFAASAVAAVVGLLVRPTLVMVSAYLGWIGVIIGGLFGQAGIVYLSLVLIPGIEATPLSALVAAWVTAAVSTLVSWLVSSGTDDAFESSMRRRGRGQAAVEDPDVDGVIFVQLDGVPFPVLRLAIQGGAVPTMRRWVTSGQYHLHEWTPQLPCTTPASQLGILHGAIHGVPAFRWYDRELGRILVANRPADAQIIEERGSNGRGLLVDGGLSLSNLFTGDAPRAYLTMSRARMGRSTVEKRRAFAGFLADPHGFMHAFVRALGEVTKERWQARRQVRHDLIPRCHRGWTFAGLRAATNVVMRDVNVRVLAEEMYKGTRSIYVNFVDYDEIAHHAGMFRPESLAALDGVDRVLGTLERIAQSAPRRYHIVAMSDHGQSQGTPFADLYGESLGDLCGRLIDEQVESVDEAIEGWGRVEALADDLEGGGLTGKMATRAAETSRRRVEAGSGEDTDAEISVLGSGNLGLLYAHSPTRLTVEEISRRWPRLIPGLRAHDGIGFIAAVDDGGRPWAFGAEGRIALDTFEVEGEDPMAPFGHRAAQLLARAVLMPEAPDLYLNSSVDEITMDIAAFEPLVGAHGGLGGWQDSAVLLVPDRLEVAMPQEHIEGADRLHLALVAMLEEVGHRKALVEPVVAADV